MANESTPVEIGRSLQTAQPVIIVGGSGPGGGGSDTVTAQGEYVLAPRNLSEGDKAPLLLNKDGLLVVNLALFKGDDQPYDTFEQPLTFAQLKAGYQGNIASGPVTLVAGEAQTLIGAFPDRRGMRVLNYTDAPVYISLGTTGTPAPGAGSDYIPAASEGVPGVWSPPYAPVGGVRAVGASAGGLTVTVW